MNIHLIMNLSKMLTLQIPLLTQNLLRNKLIQEEVMVVAGAAMVAMAAGVILMTIRTGGLVSLKITERKE